MNLDRSKDVSTDIPLKTRGSRPSVDTLETTDTSFAKTGTEWRHKPGKRVVFECGYVCQVISTILLFVAFVTPYWIQSWPRVYSGFKRIGLWEVCLAGLVLETDQSQKSYHGCWWMLSTEFGNIGSWLTPPWFIFTQVVVTLVMIAQIVNLVLMGLLVLTSGHRRSGNPKKPKRNPLLLVQTGMGITVITTLCLIVSMITFGVAFWMDRRWLPSYYLNYPSWSYGLAIVATFFSCFASIGQLVYVKIVRQEQKEPPSAVVRTGQPSLETSVLM